MDWVSDEDLRSRYRLCRAGFSLCALGLALLSLHEAGFLVWTFFRLPEIGRILESPYWKYTAGAAVTWTTLLGPYLLWRRWPEPSWRQRAGTLVVLNLLDVGLWFLRNGQDIGLFREDPGHFWLRDNVLIGASWVQFLLFASLAADVSAHFGLRDGVEGEVKARSLSVAGAILWLMTFLLQTAWHRGWPLQPQPTVLGPLPWIGMTFLRVLISFQVSALCLTAARGCTAMLREIDRVASGADVLRSRSELDGDDFWRKPPPDPWS